MSLIDDKGNIFGKLNIVDFLIILILIAVFVATVNLFNSYEELSSLDGSSPLKISKLLLTLETQVPEEYLKFITEGNKDLSNGISAVIENVETKKSGNSKIVQIKLLLEHFKSDEKQYYFFYSNNQPIFIGKPLTVNLRFIKLDTIITDVELVEEQDDKNEQ